MNAIKQGIYVDTAETIVVPEFDASGLLGTPFAVYIYDCVKEKRDVKSGEVIAHIIPMPDDLIGITAILRACNPLKLSGSEIRFLRKSVCLKSKEMAERLEISPEQFSRFENDKKPISEVYEKLLRAEVCLHHSKNLDKVEIDVRGLLGMRIKSVRDVCTPLVLRLVKVEVSGGDDITRWRNEAA